MEISKEPIKPEYHEPLMSHRFVIKTIGVDIPVYLFQGYKMYNEGDEIIFKTSFYETMLYIFNPIDFFKIVGFQIDFLDPIGEMVNSLTFDIKSSNFFIKQSYKDNKLKTYKLIFTINKETLKIR